MSLKQPVQYPVKYYSHLDAGAPQLADADGVIKTILKGCLVTGYGDKLGAGWSSLFEDDFRIVLRRPLGTGNPPDIKIENGVINGVAKHRIVSQDNPTGLNDATELAWENLLARDNMHGAEWHLIVSDFGFWFGYQMGDKGRNGNRNYSFYLGSCSNIRDIDNDFFVCSTQEGVTVDGYGSSWLSGLVGAIGSYQPQNGFKDMRTDVKYTVQDYLDLDISETYFNDEYFAQKIMVGRLFVLPFLSAITKQTTDYQTKNTMVGYRSVLRYVSRMYQDYKTRALYVPTDYWEL